MAFLPSSAPDRDEDGLPDDIEGVIGTAVNQKDTDRDGIDDFAKIENRLDPLDGIAYSTGVIASHPLAGPAQAVATEGDFAYIATGSHGLAIVDGTRFNNPVVLGQLDLPGNATDVAIDPNLCIAAVATGSTLELIDISDPMAPRIHRSVTVAATQVEVANGLAYVTSGNVLRILDVLTGDLLQTLTLPGSGTVTGLAREGTFLYAYVSGSDTFVVVDIADEGAAAVRGQLVVSIASSDVGVFVGNGVAWLAGSGLRTVNVSNPASLSLSHGADSFFSARRIALNGSGLGILTPDGGNSLQVYNTSDPNRTALLVTQFPLSVSPRDVAVSRGIAYVAAGNRLEVVNYRAFDNLGQAPTLTLNATLTDAAPGIPGAQVLEGTTFLVRAAVSDDVQVRNVELLINGQVVRNDVAFPFDFFAIAPTIAAAGGTAVTLQLRATDTGGNVGLSAPLELELVPDTFPPALVSIDPPHGASRLEGAQTIRIHFSKPLAATTVSTTNFRLRDAAGNTFTPTDLQLRNDDRIVQLTYGTLPAGNYQVVINGPAVTDRAGNPLDAADVIRSFTLTPRATLSTTVADADPSTPGLQVFEGATIPLTVTVVAGVTVQNVEFLVNGVVVGSDAHRTVPVLGRGAQHHARSQHHHPAGADHGRERLHYAQQRPRHRAGGRHDPAHHPPHGPGGWRSGAARTAGGARHLLRAPRDGERDGRQLPGRLRRAGRRV